MQHGIRAPHLLQVGVVRREAVVRAGTAGIEQTHRITLVAEGGLHANKHVAEMATEDQQVGAVGIEGAGGLAPVLFKPLGVGGEALVFLHAHAVGDRQFRGSLKGFGIFQHRLHQRFGGRWEILHLIALGPHLLEHAVNRAEHIEVGGGSHVAFIRREAEHRDRQLLLGARLDAQRGPADGALGDGIHPILQGVGLAGGVIPAREHDRLNRSIEFGDGDLQGHLHGVKAQVAFLPFLSGLEHQRQRHHVRAIELLQHFDRLGVVLTGRAAHQSKTGQRHHAVDQRHVGIDRVIEEGVHRLGEVETAAEHRNHRGSAVFHLLNHRHVVGFIASDDVAALQHQADHGALAGFLREICAAGVPVQVFLEIFEHAWGQGMPDAQIREHNWIRNLQLRAII